MHRCSSRCVWVRVDQPLNEDGGRYDLPSVWNNILVGKTWGPRPTSPNTVSCTQWNLVAHPFHLWPRLQQELKHSKWVSVYLWFKFQELNDNSEWPFLHGRMGTFECTHLSVLATTHHSSHGDCHICFLWTFWWLGLVLVILCYYVRIYPW